MTIDTVLPILFWMSVYNFVVCGLAGSYASSMKNRPAHEGFWLGCFLGPCGVIVAACLPTLLPKAMPAPRPVELPLALPIARPVVVAEEVEFPVESPADRERAKLIRAMNGK
jgi:uncharacterized membrane protein YeaQ/YmgE (transglycosylase-associated protein family)